MSMDAPRASVVELMANLERSVADAKAYRARHGRADVDAPLAENPEAVIEQLRASVQDLLDHGHHSWGCGCSRGAASDRCGCGWHSASVRAERLLTSTLDR